MFKGKRLDKYYRANSESTFAGLKFAAELCCTLKRLLRLNMSLDIVLILHAMRGC